MKDDSQIEPTIAADGGAGSPAWAAVVSLSLGVFGLVTAEFLPISLLTPMSLDLGISAGAAGQSVTITALMAALAGPGVVIATRTMDRRWTLLGLTAALVFSSLLAALASGLPMLLVSRVFLGIALGGFWATSAALALRLVPPHLMPRAMAVILTGVSVATVSAAPLGSWIGSTLGWRFAFAGAAVIGVLAFIVQAVTMPALPPTETAGLKTLATLLRRARIRLVLTTVFLVVGGHFAGLTYIRPFLELVPRMGAQAVSLVLLAFGVGGFFGNLAGGALSERSTTLSVGLASGLIAVSTIVLVLGGVSTSVTTIATVAWGFAFGAMPVSAQSMITRAAPDDPESAGALLITTIQVAIAGGAILGGLLIESVGPPAVFVFTGVAALLGAALVASSAR